MKNKRALEIVAQEIEFPYQLLGVSKGDYLDVNKMFERLTNAQAPVKLEDEVVISNKEGRIITVRKNEEGQIFENLYSVSEIGKLENINSMIIYPIGPKYLLYKHKLKGAQQ